MSMIRWICFHSERKKNAKFRKLLGFEPVSLMISKGRLRWFGHDTDWIRCYTTVKVEGIRQEMSEEDIVGWC